MAFEDIIKKIKADHEAKESEAHKDHEKRVDQLEKNQEQKLNDMLSSAKEKAKNEKKKLYEQLLSIGEADLRRELLGKKQQLLDDAFLEARNKFLKQNKDEYQKKFASLISNLDQKEGKLLVGLDDKDKLDDGFKKLVEDKTGGHFEYEISDKIKHGCVLVTGRIRYDFTLESLLSEVREKVEDKVIKALFG
ncbi:V-type ATP synthase subunit E [bacterium]|nr:V-type ATP synthase subunit E [bacterium]